MREWRGYRCDHHGAPPNDFLCDDTLAARDGCSFVGDGEPCCP